jgi:dihydropyrimidinase
MSLVVRNGIVVTESAAVEADVLVGDDGTICEIGTGLSGDDEFDASDAYVLPGIVDPHVHTSLLGYSPMQPLGEDFAETTFAGLMGGVTTTGGYVQRTPDHSLPEILRRQLDWAREHAWTDFFFNALVLPGDDIEEVVRIGVELGVSTFKTVMSYDKRGLQLEDTDLFVLLRTTAQHGVTALVHPENGKIADLLEGEERAAGTIDHGAFLRSSPGMLEAEGMYRAGSYARMVGATLLFVHLSSKEGAAALRHLRSLPGGDRISCETQPHYLCLTNQEVLQRGPLAKVGPPLRDVEDVAAVWEAVADRHVSHFASDNTARSIAMKTQGAPNILDAAYGGFSGTELLLPLAFRFGIEEGRYDIVTMSRLISTAAAKVYGLYPRKGTILRGSDADLVVVPLEGQPVEITPERLHGMSDYTVFRGMSSRGFPSHVFRRGKLVVDNNQVVDRVPPRYLASGSLTSAEIVKE